MKEASARELRSRARHLLDQVKQGETIRITRRGIAVAILQPSPRGARSNWKSIGFGIWKNHKSLRHPSQWVQKKRAARYRP